MQPYRPVLASLALLVLLLLPANPAVAQLCIPDVDCLPVGGTLGRPTVTITATDTQGSEVGGFGNLVFRVQRVDEFADAQQLSVTLSYSGTATRGTDYDAPTTIVFDGGQVTYDVIITPTGDSLPEPDESITVTVAPPAAEHYTVGSPSSASGTITEVPPSTVTVTASDNEAREAGSNTGQFTLMRTEPISEALVVNVELGGTASKGTDYSVSPDSATVSFAGGSSVATVLITPIADTDQEGVETVTLTVKASGTLATSYDVGSSSVATVNILDGNLPVVSLTATDGSASETPTSTVSTNDGAFVFQRESTAGALEVTFAVSGSATRGSDYTLLASNAVFSTNVVTFPAGSSTVGVTLRPIDDTAAEGAEVATLTLLDGSSYQASPTAKTASVTIEDNDVPVVTVTASKTKAVEPSDTITVTFTRTAPAAVTLSTMDVVVGVSGTATVRYSGTAATDVAFSGFDRTASTTSIRFTGTAATAVATLTVLDDTSAEGTESVVLTINPSTATPPAYGAGAPGTVTLSITDNDIVDTDGDGIGDNVDNCPSVANTNQANADADTLGDACDTDDDNDGLSDAQEATLGTNPRASDSDGDGRSDKDEADAGTSPLNAFSPEYRPSAASIEVSTEGDGVVIAWTAPAGSKVSRYLVFRASDPVLVSTVAGTSSTTEYSATDLTFPGGNHTYYVQAMLPSQVGSAFNATRAVASNEVDFDVCEAFTLDTDADGLCDAAEDKDRDGIVDADETDPLVADTDSDGIPDGEDSDPITPGTVAVGNVKFSEEPLVWLGLAIVLAAVALLVVGIVAAARRREPEPAQTW